MITVVVFILIIVAIEVFDKLFGDNLNPHVYIVIPLIALVVSLALVSFDEQTKSTNLDSQESTLQEHKMLNSNQEITQTEIKDNTVNLKCTVTKTGDYLCKKPK